MFSHSLTAATNSILTVEGVRSTLQISIINGQDFGDSAFEAHLLFRGEAAELIPPPYAGFDTGASGRAVVALRGGSPEHPATTAYPFSAPRGAKFVEVAVRPGQCPWRPVLLREPQLISVSRSDPGARYLLGVTNRVESLAVTVATGVRGGAKAFAAQVRFLDMLGRDVAPLRGTFAVSERLGAYFYVAGGSRERPRQTMYSFRAPPTAVLMTLELHPWTQREAAVVVEGPQLHLNSHLSGGEIQQPERVSPQGSRILQQMRRETRSVQGIFGAAVEDLLPARVHSSQLSFDAYDFDWRVKPPSHLMIEVDALEYRNGWRHALSERDPSATVELVRMVQSAKEYGSQALLVLPAKRHRFPLLSRVLSLFDQVAEDVGALGSLLKAELGE